MFNRKMTTFKSDSGMTLIEIVISIGILALVTLAVLGVFTTSLSNIFISGGRTEAKSVASEVMEKIEEEIAEKAAQGEEFECEDIEDMEVEGMEIECTKDYPIELEEGLNDDIEGYKIIITYEYEDNRSIELRSFLKNPEIDD